MEEMAQDANGAGIRLGQVRDGLLRLHKVLLDSERGVYEREIARIQSPWEMLGLLMNDPWFAWLKEISTLVVQIDERLAEDEPAAPADAQLFIGQARSLLVASEEGSGFERRYFEALQRDPNVILAHAEMMRVLTAVA